MGFFDKAKNAAITTKLKGEIALLDREMKTTKQKFGIEICDLLFAVEKKQSFGAASSSSSIFLAKESSMRIPFDSAKQDIQTIQSQKDEIQQKLDAAALESKQQQQQQQGSSNKNDTGEGDGIKNNVSVLDKAKAAGTETKRRTKLSLLDRQIKSRKEQFGIDVYDVAVDILSVANSKTTSGGTMNDAKNQGAASLKNSISKNNKMSFVEKQFASAVIGKVSDSLTQITVSDQDIRVCIEKVQTSIDTIQMKKTSKLQEIEKLKTN